jgi:adenylate kinase
MEIIIFGAPGVGKGTQAKIISKRLNIPHISTGDILRDAVRKGTEIGRKVQEVLNKGELVSDDLMGEVIKEVLQEDRTKNGFVLDGFPRTVPQAKILDAILWELNFNPPLLINLTAHDEIIIDRLSSRRACSNCGTIVNLKDLEDETVCPNCGAKNTLVKRDDDKEEVIKNRLEVFRENTAPVLDYYEDKTRIINIDGTRPIDEVKVEIFDELGIN